MCNQKNSECGQCNDLTVANCYGAPVDHNLLARQALVKSHAAAMHQVLHDPKNVAKGDWSHEDVHDLLYHLRLEIEEFKSAVCGFLHHGTPIERVRSEGADISAVVAMITDNLARRIPS